MVVIKKIGDEYFLFKRKTGLYRGNHIIQEKFSPIFIVKAGCHKSSSLKLTNLTITCPKELFGKKIMLKVVIVEDEKSKKEFKFEDLEGVYV